MPLLEALGIRTNTPPRSYETLINPTSEVLQSIDACTLMLVTELPLRVPSLSGALPLVTLRTSAHALQLRTA